MACLLGVDYIGYATLCFRGSLIVSCLLLGQLTSCVRRRTIVVASQLTLAAILASWFVPLPTSAASTSYVTVVVMFWAAVNGAIFGLMRTAMFAIFPVLFRDRLPSALAHCNVWECLGSAVAFFVNDRFCFGVKAYGLAVLVTISLVTYIALEILVARGAEKPNSSSVAGNCHVVIVNNRLSAGEDEQVIASGQFLTTQVSDASDLRLCSDGSGG